jgi:hypothetical protein
MRIRIRDPGIFLTPGAWIRMEKIRILDPQRRGAGPGSGSALR